MKRVCIILTGGTFLMKEVNGGEGLSPVDDPLQLLGCFSGLKSIANIETRVLFNLDSVNFNPDFWIRIANFILRDSSDFDGFVIVHGTDTITFTAAALSFLLAGLKKPVILTGALRPLTSQLNDARNNLFYSVEFATYNIPEVCIFFGKHLLRGNRTIKISSADFNAFMSPNYPPLASIGLDIKFNNAEYSEQKTREAGAGFSNKVICIRYFPGFNHNSLYDYLFEEYDAIIIEALGTGSLPYSSSFYLNLIKEANQKGKLFALASQSVYGKVDLTYYKFQTDFLRAGAIPLKDMTIDAALVKSMYLLGTYGSDIQLIKRLLTTSMAGEVSDDQPINKHQYV